jgi:hypothetical protein
MNRATALCVSAVLSACAAVRGVGLPVTAAPTQEAAKTVPIESATQKAADQPAVSAKALSADSEEPGKKSELAASDAAAHGAPATESGTKDGPTAGQAKGSAARASADNVATVRPFLVGKYHNAYYRLSVLPLEDHAPSQPGAVASVPAATMSLRAPLPGADAALATTRPLRFFAARFEPPARDYSPNEAADPNRYNDDLYEDLNIKAFDGARAVDRNAVSLGPQGVVNQEELGADSWIVFGVSCPVHAEQHWLGCGRNKRLQRYEVMSNSRGSKASHPARLGWEQRIYLRRRQGVETWDDYWAVALVEGGAATESFDSLGERESCGVQLRLAMPRGEATVRFAFLGPTISVGLVGEYERVSGSSRSSFEQLAQDQTRHFLVMASERTGGGSDQFLKNVVLDGEAAQLGRDVTLAEGYTLASPSTLRRFELVEGKVLVIAGYNATRDETDWLAVRRSAGDLLWSQTRSAGRDVRWQSTWQALQDRSTPILLDPDGTDGTKVCVKWDRSKGVLAVMILPSR